MQTQSKSQKRKFFNIQISNKENDPYFAVSVSHKNTMKLQQVQSFKKIEQGYFTPNTFKIKYMCKNHKNTKSTHFCETSEGQKIYYCLACSNQIARQGFSVRNITPNQNTLSSKNHDDKFLPKRFDFLKKKAHCQLPDNLEILRLTEGKLSEMQKQADASITGIDQYGSELLKQLNYKFNDVIKFLNTQKQHCIQIIFLKIDQLKQPLYDLKKSINTEKWQLDAIKSKINLLSNQKLMWSHSQSLGSLSNNQHKNLQRITLKKDEIEKLLNDRKALNFKERFQSLGSVSEIIQTVYHNFLLNNNTENQNSPQKSLKESHILDGIDQFLTIDFPSPIRTQRHCEPQSNTTLIKQIQTLQNTINRNSEKEQSIRLVQFDKQNRENLELKNIKFEINHITKKRQSLATNFSSYGNLPNRSETSKMEA